MGDTRLRYKSKSISKEGSVKDLNSQVGNSTFSGRGTSQVGRRRGSYVISANLCWRNKRVAEKIVLFPKHEERSGKGSEPEPSSTKALQSWRRVKTGSSNDRGGVPGTEKKKEPKRMHGRLNPGEGVRHQQDEAKEHGVRRAHRKGGQAGE